MIKIIIPTHLLEELTNEMITDICELSENCSEYEIVEEKRGYNTGQYIKIENNNNVNYICLSRAICSDSRNAFILQNFPSAYQHFIEETNINKKFKYYIRDFSTPHPTYAIFSYKLLLTGGVEILNLNKVVPSDRVNSYLDFRTPFLNFKQLRTCRIEMQGNNSENTSTLFEELDDEISVYGKSYGANGRETTAICFALSKLTDKPIKVYNVNETDKSHLASVDPANKIVMQHLGVSIDDGSMDFDESCDSLVAKRDTKRYHYNLLQKFHEKKCYLCGCDMENLIIGSHIHRVTDILHSSLSEEDKVKQIIDGDNGFWLCANHDKMFEWGLIYFDGDKMVINNKLSTYQQNYIYESTFYMERLYMSLNNDNEFNIVEVDDNMEFHIKPEHYNENMKNYLEKHKDRVCEE